MNRRRYLGTIGAVLWGAAFSGCSGLVSLGEKSENPEYLGGTLIVENTGEAVVNVSLTVSPDEFDASLDTSVAGGETLIRREFVSAERGDVVTVAAQLGSEGKPVEFRFLPAGGEDDSPPEVAHLTFENAVEASATWTATRGK
jgi:hypothetical protein